LSDVTYFFSVGSEGKGNEKNGEGRQDRGKEGNGKRDPVPDWQSEKVAS